MNKIFFCFGMGFVGKTLGRLLLGEGWRVIGTARDAAGCKALVGEGFEAFLFTGDEPGPGIEAALVDVSHVLNSVPPGETGDPVLIHHGDDLLRMDKLQWLGILSTVGVYGEHHGGWVDEDTPPAPLAVRSKLRWRAEQDWQAWREQGDEPIGIKPHIFRLPGIYGAGRNQLLGVQRGKARRLNKKGQVFNRAHVEDIEQTLYASMQNPQAGHLFNIADDEPAPPQDGVSYACELLGIEPPPELLFEEA
ncbi:MAG: SDR family oxidoreductase, partial [Hyphomicrobiaceae bacterium]|nr:SDR family oxidoreductase [Hyphomicrobiaceae bacterium]